jgi:hypothetical protein
MTDEPRTRSTIEIEHQPHRGTSSLCWFVIRGLLVVPLGVATVLVAFVCGPTTTASAVTFTYDGPVTARHEPGFGLASPQATDLQEWPAAGSVLARGASTTPFTRSVATKPAGPGVSSVVEDVITETRAGSGNLTSNYTLTADEALTAGERWVGPGYSEIGKPGSGVFRSADGTRQFRIDNGSITGAHNPGVPHVHLETISPGSKVPLANNHIPFKN